MLLDVREPEEVEIVPMLMKWTRSVVTVAAALIAMFPLSTLLVPAAVAQQASDARIEVRAENAEGGGYVGVRVGDEVRDSIAPTERQLLMFAPAQVAAGGRIFAFGKIPPALSGESFTAEFLVWEDGEWRRRRVIPRQAGQVGHVSATLLVPDLESGAVPTAVFARRRPGEMQVVRSGYVTVPGSASMRLAYSLDEWDWRGLGPVSLSVSAEFAPGQRNSGRRVELFTKRIVPSKIAEPRWFDETVDLGVVGGQVVRFDFTATPERSAGKLAPYVVWGAPTILDARRARRGRSVVLISLDGVRARSLSCCGSSREVSPFMDGLFTQQGVLFDHAVSQAVESVPASMTLFTSLYPSVHQVLTPRRALGEGVDTLTSVLAGAGFTTAAFTDGVAMAAELGFGRGFHTFVQNTDTSLWDVGGSAGPTFDRALAWIERNADQPFFVWIQTRQARWPHVPPRGYESLFREDLAAEEGRLANIRGLAGLRVRYDREIRYLDDVVSRFVTRLDALSDPGRTLLVVTSAHGEEFLEHGALGNGTQLYEESIRVPLMMRGAGIRPGQRYGDVIGLIDVAPTILGLLDLNVPTAMQGGSVAQALRSGLPYSLPARFTEAHGHKRQLAGNKTEKWSPPGFAVTDSGRKLIVSPGEGGQRFEAYDVVADPEESNDLLASPAAEMAAEGFGEVPLGDEDIGMGAVGGGDPDAAASPSGAAPPAPPPPPDWVPGLREKLESYPMLCQQQARPKGETPALPAGARVKLRAFGYLD
ncbi:MAG: sulfatase [Candidatus Binatia bacterium]